MTLLANKFVKNDAPLFENIEKEINTYNERSKVTKEAVNIISAFEELMRENVEKAAGNN